MANTLTNLIPDAYAALNVVSRELVGFIPACRRDATLERAAVGQTVRSHVVPPGVMGDIVPAVIPPDDGDVALSNLSFTISKSKRVPFRWRGEETRGLNNGGPGVLSIQQDQIAQAMRTLTNAIELDLGVAAAVGASRAYGTAGSTPFQTNTGETAQVRKILDDNGTPLDDRHLIINTTAGAALRTLSNLTNVNQAGTPDILTQGKLIDLNGFAIRESAQIQTPASGTGASYTTNAAGYAVGATVITLITGTGTVLAGDVVTIAGDSNKYVVASGTAAPGTITLALPGLQKAIPASATAVTVVAQSARSVAFRRNALILAQRLPALPDGGDSALDRTTITDPVSGLSFELAMYAQYRQMQYEISCAWGVGITKAEHMALLLG